MSSPENSTKLSTVSITDRAIKNRLQNPYLQLSLLLLMAGAGAAAWGTYKVFQRLRVSELEKLGFKDHLLDNLYAFISLPDNDKKKRVKILENVASLIVNSYTSTDSGIDVGGVNAIMKIEEQVGKIDLKELLLLLRNSELSDVNDQIFARCIAEAGALPNELSEYVDYGVRANLQNKQLKAFRNFECAFSQKDWRDIGKMISEDPLSLQDRKQKYNLQSDDIDVDAFSPAIFYSPRGLIIVRQKTEGIGREIVSFASCFAVPAEFFQENFARLNLSLAINHQVPEFKKNILIVPGIHQQNSSDRDPSTALICALQDCMEGRLGMKSIFIFNDERDERYHDQLGYFTSPVPENQKFRILNPAHKPLTTGALPKILVY